MEGLKQTVAFEVWQDNGIAFGKAACVPVA